MQENLIMGIVNVTPDSFSDAGEHFYPEVALQRVRALLDQGADLIDIGAESSRPGAEPLGLDEEWSRLEPVLVPLTREGYGSKLSVDSYKSEIMLRAAALGVETINDIHGGALCDDATLSKLAQHGVNYIAMHMYRTPESMQVEPLRGQEALVAVAHFYEQTFSRLLALGFQAENIWLDPGIGFGKTDEANLKLLSQGLTYANQYPIVIGISRKSFIGRTLGIPDPKARDLPSKMLELGLMLHGVKAIRTHDVKSLKGLRDLLH